MEEAKDLVNPDVVIADPVILDGQEPETPKGDKSVVKPDPIVDEKGVSYYNRHKESERKLNEQLDKAKETELKNQQLLETVLGKIQELEKAKSVKSPEPDEATVEKDIIQGLQDKGIDEILARSIYETAKQVSLASKKSVDPADIEKIVSQQIAKGLEPITPVVEETLKKKRSEIVIAYLGQDDMETYSDYKDEIIKTINDNVPVNVVINDRIINAAIGQVIVGHKKDIAKKMKSKPSIPDSEMPINDGGNPNPVVVKFGGISESDIKLYARGKGIVLNNESDFKSIAHSIQLEKEIEKFNKNKRR